VPVKTPHRPARRATSYRPRHSGVKRRRVSRPSAPLNIAFEKPHLLWLGAAAIGAGAIALPFAAPVISDGFQQLVRWFGAGLTVVVGVIVANALLLSRRPDMSMTFRRVWAGAHLLVLFAFGAAGLWKPDWGVGGVSLADVSAGGDLGRAFVGSIPGVIGWLAVGLAGAGLVWPRGARLTGDAAIQAGRYAWSLDLPLNAWRMVQGFFTALMPKPEPESERLLDRPQAAQWDEEWPESAEQDADQPTSIQTPIEEATGLVTTSAPEDEPSSVQRPLPMGRPAGHGWELPPLDGLAEAAEIEVRPVDNEARAQLIVDTLSSFGVDARVASISQGPTVTQFGVEPGWETKTRSVSVRDEKGRPVYDRDGRPQMRTEVTSKTRVRVNRVTNLANDLALALAAPTIRIEAPVPGKPIIGIEVPNSVSSLVSLRSVIESTAFQKANARSNLAIALGKGVSGEPVAADLAKMPHLLIAGATGSGKSVCINSIIACFLLHNTPEELRLVLIDPKRVEMANFADIPHLAFSKVVTDTDEVVGTLQAIIHEMDSRYRRFAALGVRNIEAHNKSPKATHQLPHWVVIIDELADLMMAAPYEVERQICRLAQLARATGIHLIIATQRPSVDVVTGLIKANFPTRIAFAVSSQVDSRTIIDGAGAEKLLGRGDMLFLPTDASKPRRLQGSYISDQEMDKIVSWWSNDRFRHLTPHKLDHLLEEALGDPDDESAVGEDEPLYKEARELALQHSRVSASLLQRRLHVGYPRAAGLIDLLEEAGIVGPTESGQSREVLTSAGDELDGRFE